MSEDSPEPVSQRCARGEQDFWLVRQFLLDCWALAPPGFVWDVRRWDGAYFHRAQAGWDAHWRGGAAIGLWQTHSGRLVGAVHPEGAGQAWLELHPAYRGLEAEMLDWAEAELPKDSSDGRRLLSVFAWDYDELRLSLLERRGYRRTTSGEHLRRWAGETPPPLSLPAGYRLHTLRPGHPADCQRYAALLNAAFRRTLHSAAEVATFTTRSPSFRTDLELVAEAPDGSFAALAGMIYDAANHYGLFEPVCATPAPRPLGLTGLLLHEGVRRATALGAEHCYVGSGYGMPANRFYSAAGFKVLHSGSCWLKVI